MFDPRFGSSRLPRGRQRGMALCRGRLEVKVGLRHASIKFPKNTIYFYPQVWKAMNTDG